MRKRNNYSVTVALIAIAAAGILSIGVTGANLDNMMGGNGMMSGMMNGFVHEQGDVDWMRDMMKNDMGFTDEEFDEMAWHCPMMGGK